jgi:hypothetical protein
MSLSHFLVSLAETGQVAISPEFAEDPAIDTEADAVLLEMDRVSRLNLAGQAPAFLPNVALWAARLFHRGCQFLVCRDVDAAIVATALQDPCPENHSPATDYSADLTLQYLPDLIRMAQQVASADPLAQQLLAIAREWPLSSVGVRGLEKLNPDGFIAHSGLGQLYVDRILAREDVSRLGDPRVDAAVREALGAFPELCEGIAKHVGLQMQA